MTQQRSNDAADLIDEFRKRDESATRVIAEWKVRAEDAVARAESLQGKIDRCVAHIREGQQLRPNEPDAGLEALVVGWVNYHGDCCNFKARAERAEARNREQERWIDEAVLALDAASVIGARSCREGDGLHLSNHDRLIREAREWSSYARYSTHSIEPLPRATLAAGLSLQEEQE